MFFSLHALFIIFSIFFPSLSPSIIIFLFIIKPDNNFNMFFISINFISLQYSLNKLYISSGVYPIAYSVATMLPDDVPDM